MSGKELPPGSAFSGDDGSADPELAALLTGHAAGAASLSDVVARLAKTRVLVPVLASLDKEDYTEDGHKFDKEASAGIVALEAPDGRKALPVFTSVATMAQWRKDARPVPADAVRAALSAVSEDWALLVVDPGSDHTALIPRPAVWAIARGLEWKPAIVDGVVDVEIGAEVATALSTIAEVERTAVSPGKTAEVAIELAINPNLTRAGLNFVLGQVNTALAGSTMISERVDSLELRVGKA
jgi:hypothetical protein